LSLTLALALTLSLTLTLTLTLALALTLSLPLPLTLSLPLTLPLPLALAGLLTTRLSRRRLSRLYSRLSHRGKLSVQLRERLLERLDGLSLRLPGLSGLPRLKRLGGLSERLLGLAELGLDCRGSQRLGLGCRCLGRLIRTL
jgi:hypothetical protein